MPDNLDEEILEKEQDSPEEKVELDLDELEDIDNSSTETKGEKVELDLDDAPFLQEEEEEEKTEEEKPEKEDKPVEDVEQAEEAKPFWKNKWFLIGGILLILGIGGGSYFLLSKEKATPPPPPPKKVEKKEEAKPKAPPPPEEQLIELDGFIVELTDNQKKSHFLEIKLSFASTDGRLVWEAKRKKIILRDAIYYYLNNKELSFLQNPKNLEKVKKDILNVVNQYLNNGQLQKVLIEKYIVS